MAGHNGLLFQANTKEKKPRPQKPLPLNKDGQPMTKREIYRAREQVKKGKTPQDLARAEVCCVCMCDCVLRVQRWLDCQMA